jgi:hypothetical protein
MPSMAVRNKAYRTWAAVEKSTPVSCGGRIFEAYCTCPAGLVFLLLNIILRNKNLYVMNLFNLKMLLKVTFCLHDV